MMLLTADTPPPVRCYASARAAYPSTTKITKIARDGAWAIVASEGEFGDEDLFQIRHGRWCHFAHGKPNLPPLVLAGVPPGVARRLSLKYYGHP